jgi:ribosome-associated translation inhibitor RaiA
MMMVHSQSGDPMQILINTDHNLKGGQPLAASVRTTVEGALSRFSQHITRVEVHLADENASKSGRNDKRCMMEARLQGHPPLAVTEHASTVAQAIVGAAERLVHLLDHSLGRRHDHRGHTPTPLAE